MKFEVVIIGKEKIDGYRVLLHDCSGSYGSMVEAFKDFSTPEFNESQKKSHPDWNPAEVEMYDKESGEIIFHKNF